MNAQGFSCFIYVITIHLVIPTFLWRRRMLSFLYFFNSKIFTENLLVKWVMVFKINK